MTTKTGHIILMALSLFALAGCENLPETSDIAVRSGMSRDDLRRHYGEPVRIESAAAGGEDWYYRFVAWSNGPTSETGSAYDPQTRTSTVTVGWNFTRDSDVQPIHISSEGFVVEPIPAGKVVQR